MGGHYTHRCNDCGYAVETSGPWEFYRSDDGSIKQYGHPGPASEEAKRSGVYGLRGQVYCIDCGGVDDVVLVEFKQPCKWPESVWLRLISNPELCEPYKTGELPVCPGCGGNRLMLGETLGEQQCPRCTTGRLVATRDWIS